MLTYNVVDVHLTTSACMHAHACTQCHVRTHARTYVCMYGMHKRNSKVLGLDVELEDGLRDQGAGQDND